MRRVSIFYVHDVRCWACRVTTMHTTIERRMGLIFTTTDTISKWLKQGYIVCISNKEDITRVTLTKGTQRYAGAGPSLQEAVRLTTSHVQKEGRSYGDD